MISSVARLLLQARGFEKEKKFTGFDRGINTHG